MQFAQHMQQTMKPGFALSPTNMIAPHDNSISNTLLILHYQISLL